MLSPWGPERDGWGSSHLSVFVSSSLQSYWGIRLHSLHIFKVIFATRRARKFILVWGELGFGGVALQPRSGFRGHCRGGGMAGDSRTRPPGLNNIIDGMFVMLSHYLFVTLGNKVCEENGWIQVFYLQLKTHSIITCENHVYWCYLGFSQRLAQRCTPFCVPLLFWRNV